MHHDGEFSLFQLQDRLTVSLAMELKAALSLLGGNRELKSIIEEALSRDRRGLSPHIGSKTSMHLLPMLVCGSLCGDYSRALPVAVAIQLMLTAGDIFDDAEDNDSQESIIAKYGQGIALNAATTSIILAERALLRLKKFGITGDICIKAFNLLNYYYTQACEGQHEDLKNATHYRQTETTYMQIVKKKSASQFECACHLGAVIAGADKALVREYTKFGRFLGMASQMANDVAGITQGKDIRAKKMSLPIIHAIGNADRKIRLRARKWFEKSGTDLNYDEVQSVLINSDAVYYTILKHQQFMKEADNSLDVIKNSGLDVSNLKLLIVRNLNG